MVQPSKVSHCEILSRILCYDDTKFYVVSTNIQHSGKGNIQLVLSQNSKHTQPASTWYTHLVDINGSESNNSSPLKLTVALNLKKKNPAIPTPNNYSNSSIPLSNYFPQSWNISNRERWKLTFKSPWNGWDVPPTLYTSLL